MFDWMGNTVSVPFETLVCEPCHEEISVDFARTNAVCYDVDRQVFTDPEGREYIAPEEEDIPERDGRVDTVPPRAAYIA